MYTLYAVMRDTEEYVMIVNCDNIEFMKDLVNRFNEGKHISKFIIMQGNDIYLEKKLEKPKTLKKTDK